ncbi:MAG TPA: AgmX/PglI C-terminal domain-containing protein, partial [Polyangiaceae bacterium]|nr:AgmX/PglI C-terminal domain-containing protein [Polyangiaceae bacterium]
LGPFRFLVTTVEPEQDAPGLRRAAPDRWLPWWCLAAAASAAFLAVLAWSVPSLAPDPVETQEPTAALGLLPVGAGALGEPEVEPPAPDPQLGALASPFFEPEGTRCGDLDRLGTPLAVAAARLGLRGPADNPEPRLARRAFPGAAAERGATPLDRVPDSPLFAVADPAAPTLPWASEDSLGTQPRSARGKPWADRIGDAAGNDAGPRLRMDGGRAKGVELARPSALRRASLGRVVHAQLAVQGPLEPSAAAQVMVTRLAALRACYHASPASRGASEGRVDLRLAVAADGRVTRLAASRSGEAPPEVVACMTASLADLAFPASPRGPSAVSYPLLLVPGAGATPALATIPMASALERSPWSSSCGASRQAP